MTTSAPAEGLVVGIDPGLASLGLAVSFDGKLLHHETLRPADFKKLVSFCDFLHKKIPWDKIPDTYPEDRYVDGDGYTGTLIMERFVSYGTPITEQNEMVITIIGALSCYFQERGWDVKLVRAVDWKRQLCAFLVNDRKFQNPGKAGKLDKKFSLAAAQSCWYKAFDVDHEADAACLAYFPTIKKALTKNG